MQQPVAVAAVVLAYKIFFTSFFTTTLDEEIQHNRINTDAGAAYAEKLKCFILPECYTIEEVRVLEVPIKANSRWAPSLEAFNQRIEKAKKEIHGYLKTNARNEK